MPRLREFDDSGAALVEAALVTLPFMFLLFAIMEFGIAYRDYLTVSQAAADGAREVSIGARDGLADRSAVQSVVDVMEAADPASIDRIVIYHPAAPTDSITASCAAGTPSAGTGLDDINACNVYTPSQLAADVRQWDCDDPTYGATAFSRPWCPQDRDDANITADYVGVYVVYDHTYITGLFGDSVELTATSVIRIEPQSI